MDSLAKLLPEAARDETKEIARWTRLANIVFSLEIYFYGTLVECSRIWLNLSLTLLIKRLCRLITSLTISFSKFQKFFSMKQPLKILRNILRTWSSIFLWWKYNFMLHHIKIIGDAVSKRSTKMGDQQKCWVFDRTRQNPWKYYGREI